MQAVIDVILPVFGLIALGYFAARTGWVKDSAADGLSRVVFDVAMPALLFRTMVEAVPPETSPWGLWTAYFGGCAIAWVLGALVVRGVLKPPPDFVAVAGLTSAYSNTMMLGLPLILKAYGDVGAVPLFMIVTIHPPIMLFAGTLHIETVRGASRSPVKLAREVLTSLLRQPVILGLLAGFLYRQTGLGLHPAADQLIQTLGSAAIPMALLSMGLTLKRYGITGDLRTAGIVLALKLVVHPLLVWWLASQVFGLPPVWVGVATLFAAAPPGINCYLFAVRYQVGVGAVSSAIAIGTALSAVTMAVILVALGLEVG
jgi:predicted permease